MKTINPLGRDSGYSFSNYQLQAGYILDCVRDLLEINYPIAEVNGLLSQLSYFDIEISSKTISYDNSNFEQVFSVAHNIISRGVPTRPSFFLEEKMLDAFKLTEKDKKILEIGTIRYKLKINRLLISKLYQALHIIDPDLKVECISKNVINTWENLDSTFEEDFLYQKLPSYASPMWIQLLETQRELESILRFSTTTDDEIDKYLNGSIQIFNDQRLDFALELPYSINGKRGIVVEIDGSQHEDRIQKIIDYDRDVALEKARWAKTIRFKTTEWLNIENKINLIKIYENEKYFDLLKQNFDSPLYTEKNGLLALEITLVPFAIARIQKTLVHLILEGKLNIEAKEWNIAILEKDIPCGNLAINDFIELINSLLILKGLNERIPVIKFDIEGNIRFSNAQLNLSKGVDRKKKYDLFIDVSVLQRSGLTGIDETVQAETRVLIRSAHSAKTNRHFKTTNLITYKKLGTKDYKTNLFTEDQVQVECLEKFVRNIFRKTGFRPGQVEIINRAIQGLSVIGLLPTGSGKSLAYQLTSLLQPGMTIVIDPIKSLMKDQYDGLLKNRIDAAVYINSSLSYKHKKIELNKIKNAQTIFLFVSPERLQDDSFRKELLETSNLKNNYFSFCVIDEAHCVSEWGHDFRTSYLRLGNNARKYCLAKERENLPFFALTATASYDVLSDIQRELDIPDENAIVRLEKLDRPEIQFKIVEVVADIYGNIGSEWQDKRNLGESKQFELIRQINLIPEYYEEFSNNLEIINYAKQSVNGNDIRLPGFNKKSFFDIPDVDGETANAGLIFFPHRKWYFGVIDNASKLVNNFDDIRIGTFLGSDGIQERDNENEKNQSAFIQNNLDLLVATKAFGMGIDKPNIRYVIHFNYPNSIESYYQEVGRCGRDRKLAIGMILFNRQQIKIDEKTESVTEDGDFSEKFEERMTSIDKNILQSFHRNSFKGISKEKYLLAELLKEIQIPSSRNTNYIEEKVYEDLNLSIRLKVETNKNDRQVLYINQNYGSIYLDRNKLPFYPHPDANSDAIQIAKVIQKLILNEKPLEMTVFDWLSQYSEGYSRKGIETLLEADNSNNTIQVVIPFTNNVIERIANALSENGFLCTEMIVKDAQNFCTDKYDFISKLEKKFESKSKSDKIVFSDKLKNIIAGLFDKIRNEEDTYKAIYRLSIIGVVDDYTVDYNSKTITAYISKKPVGYYTEKLKAYLLQYNSPENTDKKISRLVFYKGTTEIRKCLGFLIKFVYEETAVQRLASINAMEEACVIGLEENGSTKFKEFIDLYMNSKYARPQYLPFDTEKGLKADFSTVLKYMDIVKTDVGEVNNIKHLRGAATKLLSSRPDNFVFVLLKSFSVILIENENESFILEAQNGFINGFIKAHETTNDGIRSLKLKTDTFISKIKEFDLEAAEKIKDVESALYLKLHFNWLKNFNNTFTITYD